MKKVQYFNSLLCLFFSLNVFAQSKVDHFFIDSENLINTGGEETKRSVSVYLPKGYDESRNKYPVLYFLHGYQNDDKIINYIKPLLDKAIEKGKIRPIILVVSDQKTKYLGSFYSNSPLIGNWEDFTTQDLIEYTDSHYRTLSKKESRGIFGHSMGGYGAIQIVQKHPDLYAAMYALSPGLLAFVKEFGPNSNSFKEIQKIKTYEDLMKTYYPKVLAAVGRAWSPNPNNPPFYCDMPFTYDEDGNQRINDEILELWQEKMPVYNVDQYANNLRKLRAIKLDWGRNDAPRFPTQIGMYSQRLENLGIEHFAEEYIGDHGNKVYSDDGRILNEVFPFFNDYLDFE